VAGDDDGGAAGAAGQEGVRAGREERGVAGAERRQQGGRAGARERDARRGRRHIGQRHAVGGEADLVEAGERRGRRRRRRREEEDRALEHDRRDRVHAAPGGRAQDGVDHGARGGGG
jgi:hypothetical protein